MNKRSIKLTSREKDVLILVARGLTNQEIADHLSSSCGKVKTILHQACVKLEAHNRIEAVFLAMRLKTITVDEIFSLDELVELLSSLGPDSVETIARLLRQELEQEHFPSSEEQPHPKENRDTHILTGREKDVLALVARGLTNQEIADQLYMSTSTIRTFLYQACIKLEATSRAQAFISALKRRAVNVDEVFSLDELVELLTSLGPEAMERVAGLLRKRLDQANQPSNSKQMMYTV